ncbi:MAG TPA: hypothetical protein VG796_01090 [Verrucomicrobiales bacterium]|nr:hypothetical protein [Verrucomicrobiales bacterium]
MIYKFPLWIPGIAIAVAVIAAAAGVFFWWKRSQWLPAVILLAIAMFGGGIIAPGLLMDRVVLDDTKLQQTTGFWFSPTIKGFNLAGLKSIRIIKVKAMGRNDHDHDEWIATMKSGRTGQLDPGDLWENNAEDIIDRLKAKGIEVMR